MCCCVRRLHSPMAASNTGFSLSLGMVKRFWKVSTRLASGPSLGTSFSIRAKTGSKLASGWSLGRTPNNPSASSAKDNFSSRIMRSRVAAAVSCATRKRAARVERVALARVSGGANFQCGGALGELVEAELRRVRFRCCLKLGRAVIRVDIAFLFLADGQAQLDIVASDRVEAVLARRSGFRRTASDRESEERRKPGPIHAAAFA